MSHPIRGAWIEIFLLLILIYLRLTCRTPYGVRGLKFLLEENA